MLEKFVNIVIFLFFIQALNHTEESWKIRYATLATGYSLATHAMATRG